MAEKEKQKHMLNHESHSFAVGEVESSHNLVAAEAQLVELEAHVDNPEELDGVVADFVDDAVQALPDASQEEIEVAEVAGLKILEYPGDSELTADALDGMPVKSLRAALEALEKGKGVDAARYITDRLDALHKENKISIPPEIDGVNGDSVEYVPTARDYARRQGEVLKREKHERYALEHSAAQWREDTFGIRELVPLTDDLAKHFEKPQEQRRGELLIDQETGRERLPIMDISLDETAKQMVSEVIGKRSKGIKTALEELQALQVSSETAKEKSDRCHALLRQYRRQGVWEAELWGGVTEERNGPGSVADLYIDSDDLELYDQADAIINSLGGHIDSRMEINGRLLSLAVSTFPAGTELIHVTPERGLSAMRRQGSMSPRSEFMYGADSHNTPVNGSYIHCTEPGTAAYEYSDAAPNVIAIPIETIMANSPTLHFESSYIYNRLRLDEEEIESTGSTSNVESVQQPMTRFTINRPLDEETPLAFRKRFETMHAKLSREAPEVALIAQGARNNFSFAASDKAESAGRYGYPMQSVRVIMENGKVQEKQKSFNLSSEPLVVYGPMITKRVSFTEESIEGNYRPVPTLENTYPEAVPMYFGEIIANSPGAEQKVLDQALQVISKATDVEVALRSLQRTDATSETKLRFLSAVPVEFVANSWAIEKEPDDVKQEVLKRVFDRKDQLPPTWIEWTVVRESGYIPTESEKNTLEMTRREEAKARDSASRLTGELKSFQDNPFGF